MRVDVTWSVADELAGTGELRSVLDERLVALDLARKELGRPPEGTVCAHQ